MNNLIRISENECLLVVMYHFFIKPKLKFSFSKKTNPKIKSWQFSLRNWTLYAVQCVVFSVVVTPVASRYFSQTNFTYCYSSIIFGHSEVCPHCWCLPVVAHPTLCARNRRWHSQNITEEVPTVSDNDFWPQNHFSWNWKPIFSLFWLNILISWNFSASLTS